MINFIKANKTGYLGGIFLTAIALISAGCAANGETVKKNEPPAQKKEAEPIGKPSEVKPERIEMTSNKENETDSPKSAPQKTSERLTKANFDKIKIGDSLEDVEKMMGDKGLLVSTMDVNGRKMQIYKWANDNFSSYIDVTIENGKVIEKKDKALK